MVHSLNMNLNWELKFELALGYLHGLTDASANHALIWNIEFEFN